MLATFVQYSFLVFVAVANLSLGFGIACHLGWGPSGFLEGPTLRAHPATDLHSAATPDETADSAALPLSLSPNALASGSPALPFRELLREIVATLNSRISSLQILGDTLRDGEQSSRAIEAAVTELNEQTQHTLQRVGAAASQLRRHEVEDAAAKELQQAATELDRLWAAANEALVQLLMLGFEDDQLAETVAAASATLQVILADFQVAQIELEATLSHLEAEDHA